MILPPVMTSLYHLCINNSSVVILIQCFFYDSTLPIRLSSFKVFYSFHCCLCQPVLTAFWLMPWKWPHKLHSVQFCDMPFRCTSKWMLSPGVVQRGSPDSLDHPGLQPRRQTYFTWFTSSFIYTFNNRTQSEAADTEPGKSILPQSALLHDGVE